ncbi:MAG: type II secretion system secretin GspD [Candidatus Nitrohelix vancouverensis]|uniref:Type II secretion system secretin GspD n=1 Tax=Candidatus Nitrohelix vancouverensis TaxID=2705534 RepID=A0A7T0G495_9BACT|nr:MAG: type II secretion system secretin GspD [Candidatus Nitrohelix vancouverensis]
MRHFLTFILIALLTLSLGCAQKRKSTIDKLKEQTALEELYAKRKDSTKPGDPSGKPGAPQGDVIADKELKALEQIQPPAKSVTVVTVDAPLRKGPGERFKQIGVAKIDANYKLIRSQRLPEEEQNWYLVENARGRKFFISGQDAVPPETTPKETTVEPTVAPPAKQSGEAVAQAPETIQTSKDEIEDEPDQQLSNLDILQMRDTGALDDLRTHLDPSPPVPPELLQAKHITLNFEGTEVYDVITTFCELLQLDYIIEGAIEGKVTLQTFNKIDVKDLYPVLEQILALHNITVVKSGNFYRFLPIEEAQRKATGVYLDDDPALPSDERMVIQIVSLQNISKEAAEKVLKPLLTEKAQFIEVPGSQNMMLVEIASNLKRLVKIVKALDVDKLASSDIQLYRLNNANDEDVAEELKKIFTAMGFADALDKSLTFLPIERMNSILVVNTIESLTPTIDFWMQKLDQPIAEGNVSTFVYYVQNGEAAAISTLLNGIFGQSSGQSSLGNIKLTSDKDTKKTTTSTKETGSKTDKGDKSSGTNVSVTAGGISGEKLEGDITIIPDPDTNSIIIRTNPRNYPAILALIKKLDLFPQQVLIEVLIVDVTIDENTATGLQLAIQDNMGSPTVSGGVNGNTLGATLGAATASLLTTGGSLVVNQAGKLSATLQLFASDSKADILANPILVTSDNKAASISITDEVPIESSSILDTTGGSSLVGTTIEFKDVGIKLDIVPKINSDNFVNLKINQEISSQGNDITLKSGDTTPSFSKRLVNTEVVLRDKQVLIMGGLMRTTINENSSGVPYLKDIPYLGRLFGSKEDSKKKTELMLFITPHIISNSEDSEFITKQFERRLGDFSQYVNRG